MIVKVINTLPRKGNVPIITYRNKFVKDFITIF